MFCNRLFFPLFIVVFSITTDLFSQNKTEGFWDIRIDYQCGWGWKDDRSTILLSKGSNSDCSGVILGGHLNISHPFDGEYYSFKISGQEGCIREGKLNHSEFAGIEYLRGEWLATGNNAAWGSGLCCNGNIELSRKTENQKSIGANKNSKTKDIQEQSTNTHSKTFEGKLKEGEKYILQNVLFELSSDELLPESFSELSKVYEALNANKELIVQLEGHTDIIGKHKDNMRLSKQRVKTTKKHLTQKGIAANRIKLKWFGDTQPITKSRNVDERSINRRVELRVLKTK